MPGPIRTMAWGGIAFGAVLLVVGVLFLLVNQGVINIVFDFWTVCSIGLIVLGIAVMGGALWMSAMARGRWRKWAQDWEEPPQRPV